MSIKAAGTTQATDRVSRFVDLFMRSVRTGSLYAVDHPRRRASVMAVQDSLRGLLDESGALTLAVTASGLQVQGLTLSSDEAQELARRLSIGGLVYLELLESTTEDELSGLASMLALDLENLRMQDDLATMLWERQWPNVRWGVVEVPTSPVEDEPSTFNSSVGELVWPDPLLPTDWPAGDFLLEPGERDALAAWVARDAAGLSPIETASFLCQLISLQRQREYVIESLGLLRQVVESCLAGGNFDGARDAIQTLNEFPMDPRWTTDEKLRAIAEFRQGFASAESVETLVLALEQRQWTSPDAVVDYLAQLPAEATGPLFDALLSTEDEEIQELLRSALSSHLRRDPSIVEDRFRESDGPVLIEVVRLLREVGSRETVVLLKDWMLRGGTDLRCEIVSTLEQIGGAHARAVLARALSDPAIEVRVAAARALPGLGPKEALEPLFKEMLRAEFRDRAIEERLEFFRAIGSTDVPEVLPLLRKLLGRRAMPWRRGRVEEDRVCAAAALQGMTHPEAVALRAELLRDGPRSVQRLLKQSTDTGGDAT